MLRTTGYLIWRLCRILCGLALLMAGLVLSLPGVPGPGIVLIVLSLGILSHDFHWAHKANAYIKRKWHEIFDRRTNASAKRENDHGR